MANYQRAQADYADECGRLGRLAFDRYCRNAGCEALYLAGTRRAGSRIWERLTIASEHEIETRDDLELVTGERLPCSMAAIPLIGVIKQRLAREPLAIFADAV